MKVDFAFWRAPDDQPAWSRPALLVVAAASAVLYGWQATGNLEIFYAAGVRSMSMNWHNFFFAAFDPKATVTLDKLPGAFWIQALSARLFGFHPWTIVAPQVVEGTLTVLIIHRPVRRLAGPVAAIIAAIVLALSPATVAAESGQHFRHPDGPVARTGGRRHGSGGDEGASQEPPGGRRVGGSGVPGQDARGVAGVAGPGPHLRAQR